jgi:hypothetical protein
MTAVTPAAPSAEGGLGVQVLIEEARAHARRRRRRIALAVAAILAVSAGVFAAVWGSPGAGPAEPGDGARSPAAPAPAGQPRFFADTQGSGEGNSPLQIRESATGALVWRDGRATGTGGVTGLAATGRGDFVIALNMGSGCATRLYRVRLNGSGVPGALSPVGPRLPGMVWSLAAGGGGRVIGYAISGCSKGDPGYLGVLHLPSGRTRQWGGVSLGGVSPGNLALRGPLSMSANGRLLAFAAVSAVSAASPPRSRVTAQSVRVLPTGAPPGAAAGRSHVVFRQAAPGAGTGLSLAAASLSPNGTSVYLCLQSAARTRAAARIAAYDTATGKPRGVIATFTAKGTWPQAGCSSMALDASGRFLLVPDSVHHPAPPSNGVLQHIARIDIATKAMSTVTVKLPGSGGMDQESGMSIVAW